LVSGRKYRGRRIKGANRTYRSYIGLLFVIGIVIAAISAVQPSDIFLQESTIINQVSIDRASNSKINNS
jgi:hypothetical protein